MQCNAKQYKAKQSKAKQNYAKQCKANNAQQVKCKMPTVSHIKNQKIPNVKKHQMSNSNRRKYQM
jgi:hypothetical protein